MRALKGAIMSNQPPDDRPKPAPGHLDRAGGDESAAAAGQADRQARLAGALRDNLHRRKAQTRARRLPTGDPPSADD
jgi:hypothetical protein